MAPATTPARIRRGRAICFTIDTDSEQLLRAMVPNSRGLGIFLSELIRKEARERLARPEQIQTLVALHGGHGLVTEQ